MKPELIVVPLRTSKIEHDEKVVAALESLLEDAKAGEIHSLVVVGINRRTGMTHRVRHMACDATLIGALAATLADLTRQWNEHE